MCKFVEHKDFVNWSHRAFPTERSVRFMEMEYNLPVEIRFIKGDELCLSPACERESVYFAIHTYINENFRSYFEEMQNIFKPHGGRPHFYHAK